MDTLDLCVDLRVPCKLVAIVVEVTAVVSRAEGQSDGPLPIVGDAIAIGVVASRMRFGEVVVGVPTFGCQPMSLGVAIIRSGCTPTSRCS